jgi:branched-chain amino acid transport system substrate-binding protein
MLMNASKILTIAVTFALLVSTMMPILGVGPAGNAAAEGETVKIGFLNPSTGPIAVYSEAFTDAAQIAIDHLNEGQDTHDFELVEADSGCDGTKASTSAQTLVDAGVVGIAGAACSGATLGAMEVAKTAGIPLVSYASTSPALTTADDGGYMFRVVPSDAQQGIAMATMAASHGWKNPGLIYMSNDYGAGLAGVVRAAYGAGGVDMCVDISYADDTTDFSTQVAELAAAECDSLITVTYATDGAALLEEMALQGIEGPASPVCSADCPFPIMGADGIADMGFLEEFTDSSAAISVIVTKPSPGSDSAVKTGFDEAWASTDRNASAIYIHETYDAVSIIGMAAMADTDGDLRDDLNDLGSGSGFVGASGTHQFDAVGDVAGSGYEICQFNPTISGLALVCNGHWGLLSGLTFPTAIPIPIGMLNPMTGPIAQFSPGFSIAGGIAIAYMNTISPLNFQFSLTEADSGCSGTTAATAAQTLIDAGVVGIAGAACSGATLGAMEVAKAAGVPMVSYASTSPALTTAADDGYLFRVVPSDAQQGQALAESFEASGNEDPALLFMTNDYGAGFAAAFKENYQGELCAESSYSDDATDFTSMVETVIANDCDSVVMITYATDGAAIVEELANQDFDGMIFGGDGIADVTFANEFTDDSSLDGLIVTKPAAAADSPLGMLFDSIYGPTAAAMGYEGGIYTKEVFDAVAIIGLAQATAYRTPVDDGVKDMLGVVIAGPDAPQPGASGVHAFDQNGDVAGSGFDICTFGADAAGNITLDCHSSWGLFEGLIDGGIAKMPVPVPGCMDSTANNYNADATVDDGSCTFDTTEPEPEPVVDDTTNQTAAEDNVTKDEIAEVVDEVPGFGLLSAVAAIGVVLLLRRRL